MSTDYYTRCQRRYTPYTARAGTRAQVREAKQCLLFIQKALKHGLILTQYLHALTRANQGA